MVCWMPRSRLCWKKSARRNCRAPIGLRDKAAKSSAGLKVMSDELGDTAWCTGHSFNLSDIVVGCALMYLEFRFAEVNWRKDYPNLGQLTDKLAKRNSFKNTVPPAS